MEKAKENMSYYSSEGDEVVRQMQSNLSTGLSHAEAELRLKKFGENKITKSKKRSPVLIFFSQFNSPIVFLLLFATGLSFYFKEWLDGIAILIVILINSAIGFYMEFQAERSMDILKKLTAIPAKIFRNGTLLEHDSINVVPGDIIYAEAGDMVPADARILRNSQLQVDESTLTGESVPVEKKNEVLNEKTPLAERLNMLYKGTHLTKGNVWAIVTDTGMETELGKVASLVESAVQSITPLEKKLEKFSKKLIVITLGLVVIIFIAGLVNGKNFIEMLQTSVALAVAAIPEGLPIVATLALAQGMVKMARHNVIVKKLSAVETLGGTNVICTDKTGTLTENKIKVSQVVTDGMIWNDGDKISSVQFEIMSRVATLCNTAELKHVGNKVNEIGDPLETGLLKFAESIGENIDSIRQKFPKVNEEPFSSETKMMATMHSSDNGFVVYAKGAVEEMVKYCTHILSDGKPMEFNNTLKQHWLKDAEKLAESGLRVIAGAYKKDVDKNEKKIISELTFVGLFGMMDPPRKEVYNAIQECRSAGIKVIMVTGDHPSTAKNIGTQLGIYEKDAEVIVGSQMKEYDLLSEDDKARWSSTSIFARVSPKQKLDLVKVLQEKGNVVGMTGDGVNDAPALKKADIGIVMGLRGTQVAQEVADMILKDDSFNSIVTAIKQGRIIFENIQKFVIFLLSCNLSELLVIAVASIFSLHFQLFPLQILFINLITDVLPALALGVIEGNDAIMKQKPKSIESPIIDTKKWWTIIFYSAVIATTSLGGVFISHFTIHAAELWNPQLCNNILFYSIIFSQLLHVFNMGKSGTNYFKSEVFKNRYVWLAVIVNLALVIGINFSEPIRNVLSVYPMSSLDWIISIASAIAAMLIIQFAKHFKIVTQ